MIEELTGSFEMGLPFENQRFINLPGKILSTPIACNVLGATIIEPKAEEIECL